MIISALTSLKSRRPRVGRRIDCRRLRVCREPPQRDDVSLFKPTWKFRSAVLSLTSVSSSDWFYRCFNRKKKNGINPSSIKKLLLNKWDLNQIPNIWKFKRGNQKIVTICHWRRIECYSSRLAKRQKTRGRKRAPFSRLLAVGAQLL